jgi:hypothetical protein
LGAADLSKHECTSRASFAAACNATAAAERPALGRCTDHLSRCEAGLGALAVAGQSVVARAANLSVSSRCGRAICAIARAATAADERTALGRCTDHLSTREARAITTAADHEPVVAGLTDTSIG